MCPDSGRFHTFTQESAYVSPWSLWVRCKVLLWQCVWLLLFRPTPKPLKRWRCWLLRLFGCRITGRPFVSSSAIIKMPWNLVLEDCTCLGPGSEVYNLGRVVLRERATVAQQVYLCAGTHDFSTPRLPLVVGEIEIGPDAFIGARAFILPGVRIGAGTVVGACSLVAADTPPWTIVAGNPAKVIKQRVFSGPRTGQSEEQPPAAAAD